MPTQYPAVDYLPTEYGTQYAVPMSGKIMRTSYSIGNSPVASIPGDRARLESPIFKRNIGMRELFFVAEADAQLFDQIQAYRSSNIHQHHYATALIRFGHEFNGDAIVKMVYGAPFYDFILKFKIDGKSEDKDIREAFEDKLMEQGLFLEYEPSVDELEKYVKVIVPFERLCKEAESLDIRFPLKEVLRLY